MKTASMLLFPLFILLLVACSTPEPTPDIPATVTLPSDAASEDEASKLDDAYSGKGYKIRPPLGWDANEGAGSMVVFFLNPSPDSQAGVPFQANINIIREPAPEITLQGYVDANTPDMPLILTNHKFIDDSASTVNGQSAHFLESTFQQGVFNLRNRQLILLNDAEAFVVTVTALEDTWESYRELFDASLRSFESD